MAVDHYEKLASNNENERLQAANAIIKRLKKSKEDSDWDSALERLVNELSSSSQTARHGASLALSRLLEERAGKVGIKGLVEKISDDAKDKKSKDKDYKPFGENGAVSLGIQALIRSKSLMGESTTIEDFKSVIDLIYSTITSNDKSVKVLELYFSTLCGLAENLENASFDADVAAEYIVKKLEENNLALTPGSIAVYLSISPEQRTKYSLSSSKSWVSGDPLAKGNLPNLTKVLQKTTPDVAPQEFTKHNKSNKKPTNQKAKAVQQPLKFAFVWEKIAQAYVSLSQSDETVSKKSKSDKKSSKSSKPSTTLVEHIGFEEFWKTIVDDALFSQSAPVEKRISGIEIFSLFLPILKDSPESILKSMFSPNLVRALSSAKQDKSSPALTAQLLKSIKSFSSTVIEASKLSPILSVTFLEAIYASKSSLNFDQATKTKTVQELSRNVTAEAIPKLIRFFLGVVIHPFSNDPKSHHDEAFVESRRRWALDHIVQLLRSSVIDSVAENEWLDELLETLIRSGFFKSNSEAAKKPSKEGKSKDSKKRKHESTEAAQSTTNVELTPTPAFTQKTITQIQERTASITAITVSFTRSDGVSWPYRALSKIIKLESSDSGFTSLVEFSGDVLKHKIKTLSTLEKIRNKRQSSPHVDSPELSAFEMLFSLVLFQLYAGDTESGGVLDELQTCFNSIQSQKDSEVGGEDDEEDEMDTSLVLTQILLSFISRESALLRKISETVWKTFSSQITRDSLQRLYDVLTAQETAEGQSKLFENIDDLDGDFEDDDEDEDDEDEDEEAIERDNKSRAVEDDDNDDEDDKNTASSDSSGEDDEESRREEIEKIEEESRRKLALALGISGEEDTEMKDTGDDDSHDDSNDEDDDDDSVNDEQMLALDDHLAAIFRERRRALLEHNSGNKERKQEAKAARHNMVQFKTRIVDLLEVYIKEQQDSPLILTMVVPLLNAIKNTKDKNLGEKIVSLLKKSVCKIRISDELVAKIRKDATFEEDEDEGDDECCGGKHNHEHEHGESKKKLSESSEEVEAEAEEEDDDMEIEEEEDDGLEVTTSDLIQWIQEVHSIAWKSSRNSLSQSCNQCSVFLSKVLLHVDEDCLQAVLSVYMASLQDWISRRQNKVTIAMFNDFLNWAYTFRQKKLGPAAAESSTLPETGKNSKKSKKNKANQSDDEEETPKSNGKSKSKKSKKSKGSKSKDDELTIGAFADLD